MLYIKIHPLTISMSRERSHYLQLQKCLSKGEEYTLHWLCKYINSSMQRNIFNLVIDEKDVTIIAMSMTRTDRTNKNIGFKPLTLRALNG